MDMRKQEMSMSALTAVVKGYSVYRKSMIESPFLEEFCYTQRES